MALSDQHRAAVRDAIQNASAAKQVIELLDVAEADAGSLTLTLASGGNLIITNLPTSDPSEAGALYNSSGTIKISSG